MRVADRIELTSRERKTLAGLYRRGAPRIALRSQIILLAAEGARNDEIAAELGISEKTVSLWRRRFLKTRVEALNKEARTPGKKRGRPSISPHIERVVLNVMTEHHPDHNQPYWTPRAVAKIVDISESTVRRIWRKHGINPHLGIGVSKRRF